MAAASARAQLVHRGVNGYETITETAQLWDTWEQGGVTLGRSVRDVLVRTERTGDVQRSTQVDLMLFGPWGTHVYTFDELRTWADGPAQHVLRTTWRAIDVNGDGQKEIAFIERVATVRTALAESGQPADKPGPFFDDFVVTARYLERSADTLVQHDVEGNPDDPVFAALLAHEMGGATNAALQLLAADWLFDQSQFEKARYRYQAAREWAERELTGREVLALDPKMQLDTVDPDIPAFTWVQAVRRIGALPAWYQRH